MGDTEAEEETVNVEEGGEGSVLVIVCWCVVCGDNSSGRLVAWKLNGGVVA